MTSSCSGSTPFFTLKRSNSQTKLSRWCSNRARGLSSLFPPSYPQGRSWSWRMTAACTRLVPCKCSRSSGWRVQEVHVVCVDPDQEHADRCVERAIAFLHSHHITARAYARACAAAPADVLLEHVHQVQASLLVMGAYGRSALREFFAGSVTRTMLRESPVPLFFLPLKHL